MPVTLLPSGATVAEGATGAVVSGAAMPVAADTLPAPSAWVTASVPPFACGVASCTAYSPDALAVAVPIAAPPASRTVTVAPASAVPVMIWPVASIVALGAAGAVRSGAIAVAGGDTAPAASAWVTRIVSPSSRAGVSVTL